METHASSVSLNKNLEGSKFKGHSRQQRQNKHTNPVVEDGSSLLVHLLKISVTVGNAKKTERRWTAVETGRTETNGGKSNIQRTQQAPSTTEEFDRK